jgi:hypothetical protein
MKNIAFCDVTTCSLIQVYQGTIVLSPISASCCHLGCCLFGLLFDAEDGDRIFHEMWIKFYQNILRHIKDDSNPYC